MNTTGVGTNPFGPGTTGMNVRQAVFAGLVDPGNIVTVRELLTAPNGTAVDTALFSGAFTEYSIERNLDGSVTVAHIAPAVAVPDDGIDTLWNVERAQFTDQTFDLTGNQPNTTTVTIGGQPARENVALTSTVNLADPNGVVGVTPTLNWQRETTPNVFVTVASGATFTPSDPDVGHRLRLAVSFTDNGGFAETALSAPTAAVLNVNDAPVGNVTMTPAPQRAQVSTATRSFTDGDGVVGVTFGFRWESRTGTTGAFTPIAGAISPTFTPTAAQVGRFLRVVVTYTDNHGTLESVASAAAIVGDLFPGTAGNDTILGTAGRDSIFGLAGTDTLSGNDGDDVITGGADDDTINGQNGDDVIMFSGTTEGFDAVTGGAGTDTIKAGSNGTVIGLRSLATVESIIANGFANVTIAGSPAPDTLNFGNVTLTNIVSISGGTGGDTLTGSVSDDRIIGGADDDVLNGQAGNDTFEVGLGAGFDAVTGAGGTADTIKAMANNVVIGLRSIATVEAITVAPGVTGVTIAGNGDPNVLNFGGVTMTGIGSIDGGGGGDTITGTAAADVILGGAGDDTMNGGAGNNIFRFAAGFGADIINGFDASQTTPVGSPVFDRIDLTPLGITAATFAANVTIAAGPVANSTLVTVVGGGTIVVNGAPFPGTAANSITIADFILVP